MDELSSEKQANAAPEESSTKAAAGSGKQVADVNANLTKITRTLIQLELELMICNRQIDNILKRREDLIQQICLLISNLERTLMFYDQAEHARRKFEETLSAACFDIDDVDYENDENQWRQEIVEDIHEIQEDVVRAERQVELVRRLCAYFEPQLKLQKVENETIHASLCEKLGKIERSRQEAIAIRKQLLKARNSMKNEK